MPQRDSQFPSNLRSCNIACLPMKLYSNTMRLAGRCLCNLHTGKNESGGILFLQFSRFVASEGSSLFIRMEIDMMAKA